MDRTGAVDSQLFKCCDKKNHFKGTVQMSYKCGGQYESTDSQEL